MANREGGKIKYRAWIVISLSAFFPLLVTLSPVRLAIVCSALAVSIWVVIRDDSKGVSFNKSLILIQLAIMLFAATRFYEYWKTSAYIKTFSSMLSLRQDQFLVIICVAAIGVSFFGLNIFLNTILNRMGTMRAYLGEHLVLRNLILMMILVLFQLAQLQRSTLDYLPNIFRIQFRYLLINIAALSSLSLLVMLLLRREKLSAVISSTVITVFSTANFYVIQLHGSPLLPSEFANTRTALNVLSGYTLTLSPQLVDVIALFFAELFLASRFAHLNWRRGTLTCGIASFASCAMITYLAFFSPIALKNVWQFSWNASVMYNGFFSSAAYDVKNTAHPLLMPGDYSASEISVPVPDSGNTGGTYPDIIMILNESFCDLEYYSDLQTDSEYLAPFYQIENASYGIAFSPDIGGGTNDSEFELLTSNSMKLLAASAPFTFLDFHEKNATTITYLKSLGYSTTAMHNSTPENYSRHIAYPALGFDHVYLGENSFSVTNYNGNRPVLDVDDYNGMISLYERDVDGPRFYYLLTYQNHGGWEQNDDALDTIHTLRDWGSLTDDLNEYLSSVSLSAKAFHDLTDYFADCDRPVIICMVGDHAPSLINRLEEKHSMSPDEAELMKRAVPFAVWSNFGCALPDNMVYSSMTDLIPQILSYSNLPLTPFYQQILDLHETVPVRTRYGICLDAEGNVFHYDENAPLDDPLKQYFFMEYNGLTAREDYLPELFRIP